MQKNIVIACLFGFVTCGAAMRFDAEPMLVTVVIFTAGAALCGFVLNRRRAATRAQRHRAPTRMETH